MLRKGIKIRHEAVEQYTAGGRQDLVDTELAQIKVLEDRLLPDIIA